MLLYLNVIVSVRLAVRFELVIFISKIPGVLPQTPTVFIFILEKTRMVGSGEASQSGTKLFKRMSTNCFLFQLR